MVVSSHSPQELYLVAPRPGSWTWHKLHPDKIEQRSRFRMDRHMCSILANPQSCLPWPILYRSLGDWVSTKRRSWEASMETCSPGWERVARAYPLFSVVVLVSGIVNETTLEVWSTLGLISRTNLDTSSIYFVSSHNRFMCALSLHPHTHIVCFVGEGGMYGSQRSMAKLSRKDQDVNKKYAGWYSQPQTGQLPIQPLLNRH